MTVSGWTSAGSARGLDAFDELPELGEPRERILDTVVDLQKRDERLPVGQQ